MIKFIKEAKDAVVTRKENLEIIKNTNEQLFKMKADLDIVHQANEKAQHRVNSLKNIKKNLEKDIKKREDKIQKLIKEEAPLLSHIRIIEKDVNALSELYNELLENNKELEREISKKEFTIKELNTELFQLEKESKEDPNIRKRKGAARLSSALRQLSAKAVEPERYYRYLNELRYHQNKYLYPYALDSSMEKIINNNEFTQFNMKVKAEPKKEIPKPKRDQVLDDLMRRYCNQEDLTLLAYPKIINSIVNSIQKNSDPSYDDIKAHAKIFYTTYISKFFKLLIQKEYPINGNEQYYLELLKHQAIKINYSNMENNFFPLFQLNPNNNSLADVVLLYIQLLDEDKYDLFNRNNLLFLNQFLVKEGFRNKLFELHHLENLVNNELKNYEIIKLEKSLFENTVTNDNWISFENIESMSGEEFEEFLVELLSNLGFRAKQTKASGDQGVDVIAKKQGKRYAIQAKRYSSSVGNKAVQEVVSGKEYYSADVSWVITNSTFTQSAKNLANKTNTILWDGNDLRKMMELVKS